MNICIEDGERRERRERSNDDHDDVDISHLKISLLLS